MVMRYKLVFLHQFPSLQKIELYSQHVHIPGTYLLLPKARNHNKYMDGEVISNIPRCYAKRLAKLVRYRIYKVFIRCDNLIPTRDNSMITRGIHSILHSS